MPRVEQDGEQTWRQVAVVVDGKDLTVGRTTLLTASAGAFTVTVNGRRFMTGTTTVVSEGVPHESDVFVARGPGAGKTLRQISRIEGDVLVACSGPLDGMRPTAFTSERGSGQTLSVWIRVKPEDLSRHRLLAANWQFLLFFLLAASAVDGAGALKKDASASLGYWGGQAFGVLAVGGFLTIVALLLRWNWRAGLALGLSMSIALNAFDELRLAVTPALGALGATAVGGATALVAGWIAWALVSRLLKLQW